MGTSNRGVYKLSAITVVFYTNGIVVAYRGEFVFMREVVPLILKGRWKVFYLI